MTSLLKSHKVIACILFALNILDFILTSVLVNAYGPGAEANYFVKDYIVEYGTIGILYAKAPYLILLSLIFIADKLSKFTQILLNLVTLFYLFVVSYSIILVAMI